MAPFADAAPVAARWWADRIRAVRPETDGLHPGLTNQQALVATAAIALRGRELASAAPADEAALDTFARELTGAIAAATGRRLLLYVDYEPDPILAQAAATAGIDAVLFPGKARMQVWPDHILARAAYGDPLRLAWSAPGWIHPPCGVQDWPDDSEDPIGPKCARPSWHDGPHDWQRGH